MPASLTARLLGFTPVVTFVTVGELKKWAEMRVWGQRRRGALDHCLNERPVIDSDDSVSRLWQYSRSGVSRNRRT